MYSVFNIERLETYQATADFAPTSGFAMADLLSRKTKLKTYRRSSLRGKLNALSKKPFEKWRRQSPIRVNSCVFVVNFNYLCVLGLSRQSLCDGGCPRWLNSSCLSAFVAKICVNPCLISSCLSVFVAMINYAKQTQSCPPQADSMFL